MTQILRIIGFLCIALWLLFMIGDWTNTIDTQALFGIKRLWVTLSLLVVGMVCFGLANRRGASGK